MKRILVAASIAASVLAGAAAADPVGDAKGAQDALNKGDNLTAVNLFSRAIDSHGLSREALESAYLERATAYVGLKRWDWALADLDLAAVINPSDADVATLRGQVPPTATMDQAPAASRGATLYSRGDYGGALTALNRAIDLKSNDDYSLYERGLTWIAYQQWDKAIADLTAVIRIKATYGAYAERGAAWAGRGNYDQALSDYNAALRMHPDDAPSIFGRGQTYAMKGDANSAINDFTQAINLQPNVVAYLYARCQVRAAANTQLDAALADCNQGLSISPNDPNLYDARAFVRYRRGGFRPAIADAQAALNLDPRHASSLYIKGLCEMRLGDNGAGQSDIRAAQGIDPKVGDYYAKWGVR